MTEILAGTATVSWTAVDTREEPGEPQEIALVGTSTELHALAEKIKRLADAADNAALPVLPPGTRDTCPAVLEDGSVCGADLCEYEQTGELRDIVGVTADGTLIISLDSRIADDGGSGIEELYCDGRRGWDFGAMHYWQIPGSVDYGDSAGE